MKSYQQFIFGILMVICLLGSGLTLNGQPATEIEPLPKLETTKIDKIKKNCNGELKNIDLDNFPTLREK